MKKNTSKERKSANNILHNSRSAKHLHGLHRGSNSSYYTNQSTKMTNTIKSSSQYNLKVLNEKNKQTYMKSQNPTNIYKTFGCNDGRFSNWWGVVNGKILSPLLSWVNLNSTVKESSDKNNIELK